MMADFSFAIIVSGGADMAAQCCLKVIDQS
jgi:hypothetical protein